VATLAITAAVDPAAQSLLIVVARNPAGVSALAGQLTETQVSSRSHALRERRAGARAGGTGLTTFT
jgi:hypothetical protein